MLIADVWNEWSKFTRCTDICQPATRQRTRTCATHSCVGDHTQKIPCQHLPPCPKECLEDVFGATYQGRKSVTKNGYTCQASVGRTRAREQLS